MHIPHTCHYKAPKIVQQQCNKIDNCENFQFSKINILKYPTTFSGSNIDWTDAFLCGVCMVSMFKSAGHSTLLLSVFLCVL